MRSRYAWWRTGLRLDGINQEAATGVGRLAWNAHLKARERHR
jgi:hypothetical protein